VAILAGSDVEVTGAATTSISPQISYGRQATVLKTGTITTLVLKEMTSATVAGELAVVRPTSEGAFTPEKGTILASGTGTESTEGEHKRLTTSALSLKVVKGEVLWLCEWSALGNTNKWRQSGGTELQVATSNTKESSLAEALSASAWTQEKHGTPRFIAEGEEATTVVMIAGGGKVKTTGYQQPQGSVKVTGGGAVKVTGAAAVVGRVIIGGGGAVKVAGEAKVIPPVKINGGGGVKVAGYQQPAGTVKVRGGGSVLVESSQYYHYGPGAQETFEAFPATKPGSPMVLAFHGGGWAGKANDLLESRNKVCVPLQTNGCATFNVFYHTPTETTGSFPESVENLVAGVEYIVAKAESYNGDSKRVFLFGNSAGGHLAAMVYEKLAAKGFPIAGVITYSGLPHLPDLFKETETYATSNEYIWGDEELIAHIQEALYQSLPVTVELECEAGSKVLKNVPWPVIKAMEDKKYVSSVSVQGGVQKSPVKGFPNGRHEEGIGEVEIESNAGASGTKVVCIIEINQVTAELSNTTKAREWQEQWSPAIQPVSGFAKWLIISSEKEVVGPATSQALQEHLEAEGVWDKRCKRILRTASKAEQHANGFEEIIGENPAEGKGHALAYWTEQKPTILAFLFADEAAVVRGGGAVKVAGFQQPQGPVKIGGGGRVKVTSSSAASAHVTVAGGGSTVVRGFQQPQASPVIHGGGRVVIHGEVFSGALVHVTGGGAVKATGYQQPAGGVKIRGGGRVVFHTPAPATPAYCYAVTVPATYSYAAVTP